MTTDSWLDMALRDAERRGLPALRPLLEGLARAASALRDAVWNADARAGVDPTPRPDVR